VPNRHYGPSPADPRSTYRRRTQGKLHLRIRYEHCMLVTNRRSTLKERSRSSPSFVALIFLRWSSPCFERARLGAGSRSSHCCGVSPETPSTLTAQHGRDRGQRHLLRQAPRDRLLFLQHQPQRRPRPLGARAHPARLRRRVVPRRARDSSRRGSSLSKAPDHRTETHFPATRSASPVMPCCSKRRCHE
jgi:hypothetical protein